MRLALLALLSVLVGCAIPMSTLHTGMSTPKGAVEADLAVGVSVDSAFVSGTAKAGGLIAEKVDTAWQNAEPVRVNDQDLALLSRAAMAWVLVPPVPVTEARARVGLGRGLELGLMGSTGGWGGHAKLQLLGLRPDQPFDLAVALQVQRLSYDLPIPAPVGLVLDLGELSRTDLVVPVIASAELGELGFLYGGASARLALLDASLIEFVTDEVGLPVHVSGPLWGVGGVIGGGVGFRYVYLVGELNIAGWRTDPALFGKPTPLAGLSVTPVLSLRLRSWDPRKQG